VSRLVRAVFFDVDDTLVDYAATPRLAALNRSFVLFDDVVACLAALRERSLRLGVITNNDGPHQRRKLAAVGLGDSFDALAISGEVGVGKPDRAIFEHACAALGVEPGAAVHVGDRLDLDALAATEAGLRGVWLDRRREAGGEGQVPVVTSLAELPALVL